VAFWVYILRCADGSYYTGHTDNLERRAAEHQSGAIGGYTAKRRPVTLAWSQEMTTRFEALDAERQIKPWSRKKKEGLIRGDWAQVYLYARPPCERASTSLGTNGDRGPAGEPLAQSEMKGQLSNPLVLSELGVRSPTPLAPSEVEGQRPPRRP
jgi:predicted GIY-YIG superfamily endonuclease